MAIKVTFVTPNEFAISPKDMVDGNAYIDADGTVFIASYIQMGDSEIFAFSICGDYTVSDQEFARGILYKEVNPEITVK